MIARHDGYCALCDEPIVAGHHEIARAPLDDGWAHIECLDAEEAALDDLFGGGERRA